MKSNPLKLFVNLRDKLTARREELKRELADIEAGREVAGGDDDLPAGRQVTLQWIATRLQMGTGASLSNLLSRRRRVSICGTDPFSATESMRTSGSETLATAANIFMGQTEAPLVIKPYLAGMTRSELLAIERRQTEVVEKILRHCGLWEEAPARDPPPVSEPVMG